MKSVCEFGDVNHFQSTNELIILPNNAGDFAHNAQ